MDHRVMGLYLHLPVVSWPLGHTGWIFSACTTWILYLAPGLALVTGFLLHALLPSDRLVMFVANLTRDQALVPGFIPVVGSIFVFVLTANWLGSCLPWTLIEIPAPAGEIKAPTNDINVTACLALITQSCHILHRSSRVRADLPSKVPPTCSLHSTAELARGVLEASILELQIAR